MVIDHAVNFGESLAPDFGRPDSREFEFQPRSELARESFLSPPAHAPTDVPTVNSQVASVPVDTADDDMNVWVISVVVVDRSPDESPSECPSRPAP